MSFEHLPKPLMYLLRTALVVTTLIWPIFMDCMTAYGWLLHADHYGDAFRGYAYGVFVGAGLMSLGVVLCLVRWNAAAGLSGTVGFLSILIPIVKAVAAARENSWGPQTEQGFGQLASDLWSDRMYPTVAPFVLLLLVCFLQFFSYEAVVRRQKKREARLAAEHAPAPHILDE